MLLYIRKLTLFPPFPDKYPYHIFPPQISTQSASFEPDKSASDSSTTASPKGKVLTWTVFHYYFAALFHNRYWLTYEPWLTR